MSSYALEVRRWLGETRRDFGKYIPAGFPVNYMLDSRTPDWQKERLAGELEREIRRNLHQQAKPAAAAEVYLSLVEDGRGNMCLIDRSHNRTVAVAQKRGNCLTFHGDPKYITQLGGRGEFSTIANMLQDGSYLHDKKP